MDSLLIKLRNRFRISSITFLQVSFFILYFGIDLFSDNQPFPIIYLRGIEHPNQFVHAVVLKGWQTGSWWQKYLPKWAQFSPKTMLKVRNSSKGQTVFGQVQQGEHEIEYKITRDNNAWNLYADMVVYIKLF